MTVTPHASMTTLGSHRAPVELFEPEPAAVIRSAAHRAADAPVQTHPTAAHASLRRKSVTLPHVTAHQLLGLVIALVLVAAAMLRLT